MKVKCFFLGSDLHAQLMKDFLYTNEWFHRNPVRFSVCKVSHHLLICIRFKCATWKQVHKLKSYASIVVILVINKHSCYSVMQIVAKLWYFLSQHTNRSVQYGWTDLYIKNIGWPRDTAVQISWWLDKICRRISEKRLNGGKSNITEITVMNSAWFKGSEKRGIAVLQHCVTEL